MRQILEQHTDEKFSLWLYWPCTVELYHGFYRRKSHTAYRHEIPDRNQEMYLVGWDMKWK